MDYGKIADLLARLLVGVLFIFAGIENTMQWQTIVQTLHQKAVPFAMILVAIMIIIQIIGGAALVLGFKLRATSIVLMLLLIAYAVVFALYWHPSWTTSLESNQLPQNIGIFAALLLISCRKG